MKIIALSFIITISAVFTAAIVGNIVINLYNYIIQRKKNK